MMAGLLRFAKNVSWFVLALPSVAETSATVEITIEAHARLGDRDNGGLRLVASTECDDVGHRLSPCRIHHRAAQANHLLGG